MAPDKLIDNNKYNNNNNGKSIFKYAKNIKLFYKFIVTK